MSLSAEAKTKLISSSLVVSYQWMDWYFTHSALQSGTGSEISPIAKAILGSHEQEAFNTFKLVLAPILVLLIARTVGKHFGKKYQISIEKNEVFVHRVVNLVFFLVILNNMHYTYGQGIH